YLTSISTSAYQSKWVPIAFGDGAQSSPEQGHYLFDNIKVSVFTQDSLVQHSPILITHDADFAYQGWPGEGTSEYPYIIESLNITGSGILIQILNTRADFSIIDNYFKGDNNHHGIELINVTRGTISNNIIYNCGTGLKLNTVNDTLISNNTIRDNSVYGINVAENSMNNTICNNTLFRNENVGIPIGFGGGNFILYNNLSRNGRGITLAQTENNKILYNRITSDNHLTFGGLTLYYSNYNELTGNTIYGCSNGIRLDFSNYNTISRNQIINSTNFGIYFSTSNHNTITWNNYISSNIGGSSQGFDDSTNNSFCNNFWDDWISPDNDGNGVVDLPYSIDGSAENYDYYPQVTLGETLHLTVPVVISPSGGEIISETKIIEWTPSIGIDFPYHSITYSLYYSIDNGLSWISIITNLVMSRYSWDTTSLPESSNYKIQIIANCSENFSSFDMSDSFFSIDNNAPMITLTDLFNDTLISDSEIVKLSINDTFLDSVWYTWDNTTVHTLTTPYEVTVVNNTEGHHWLNIFANDTVGHQASKRYRFFVNFLPEIVIKLPNNNSVISANSDIEFHISDTTLTEVWYHWDLQPNISLVYPFLIKAVNSSGNHRLFISARDSWNATSTHIFSFYIMGSASTEVVSELPSTAYSGHSFVYSFNLTNEETIPLNLTLIVFGLNDEVLNGNNSVIFLNPGEEKTIELVIRPKLASIHQLEVVFFFNEMIYHQFSLDFNVNPSWMSPDFYIPFIIFPIIIILLMVFIGLSSFYLYRSTQQLHQVLTEKLSPDRKNVPLSEIQKSTKIPKFLIRMGVSADRNLILTSDGQIVNKGHQINYIKRQITMINTPTDLLDIAQEHNCSIILIQSLVKEELNQKKLTGFLDRDVFYPSTFINLVSKTIKRSKIEQLSKLMAKFQLNRQILVKIVKGLTKTDETIFSFYMNSDEDKIVIITNQTWKEIAKYLASSTGLKIGQIIPDLTASNWQSIFKQQKFTFFQYNERFFNINGLQEYSVNHLDEISRIIHYVRHQLPHLPLSRSSRNDILQSFEQLLPVEPVHLPYFCQMDSA
ncbi:MAG: NosD domain-containing protein, partial [Candidatus Kariarchaeaceae archaeon]